MAERSSPPPLWELFEQLEPDLQRAIVELLRKAARKQLRLACSSARALLNSRVARIALAARQLIGRPLRLHERFPRLEVLQLLDAPGALTESDFADFSLAELARLASLTELDLHDCKSLGTAAAMALQQCCPQLRHLDLEGTGGSSHRQLMGTLL
jgi:hypothetical protein